MINRAFYTICILCISMGAKAHQPDLSTTLFVEHGENKWVLQVSAALIAFEYEIEKNFGPYSYTSPAEFRQLVLKHVEENISIVMNGDNTVHLQNGMVKLGHETTVTFEAVDTPENIESMSVENRSFSDISRNQTSLIILKEGFEKDQFILNDSNGHMISLEVGKSTFEVMSMGEVQAKYLLILLAAALTLILLIFLDLKYRNVASLRFE